jgi:CRP-like cAMP-binding protein
MRVNEKFIQVFAPGATIFLEGARGDEMYVVQQGHVTVHKEDSANGLAIATLAEGEIFGEMALVDSGVRSATVRAGDAGATLVCIDQARFVYLVSQQPAFALCVMKVMAKRISES